MDRLADRIGGRRSPRRNQRAPRSRARGRRARSRDETAKVIRPDLPGRHGPADLLQLIDELNRIAKKLRVQRVMQPYLETVVM